MLYVSLAAAVRPDWEFVSALCHETEHESLSKDVEFMRAGSLVARELSAAQVELLPKLMRDTVARILSMPAYVLAGDGEKGRQGLECLNKQ